jgi:hypothetical protein
MVLFDEAEYYTILRKHERFGRNGGAPLGARTRLEIDSDLESELVCGSSSDDEDIRSTGAVPKRSNPVREHYATLYWVCRTCCESSS